MAGKPGRSGRRPNDQLIRDRMIAAVNEITKGDPKGRTVLDEIVACVIKRARDGDLLAAAQIFDRIDGKPKQQTEISGDGGGPVRIIFRGFKFDDDDSDPT